MRKYFLIVLCVCSINMIAQTRKTDPNWKSHKNQSKEYVTKNKRSNRYVVSDNKQSNAKYYKNENYARAKSKNNYNQAIHSLKMSRKQADKFVVLMNKYHEEMRLLHIRNGRNTTQKILKLQKKLDKEMYKLFSNKQYRSWKTTIAPFI